MPKVSQVSVQRSVSSGPLGTPNHPNVLKRNQACHQCRRRKLKCDAKRPCSTCVRSHAHQLNHAPPGANIPPRPECTFDEIAEVNPTPSEGPKSKYERLENRINELETLLRQKESKEIALMNSASLDSAHRQCTPSATSSTATRGKSDEVYSPEISISRNSPTTSVVPSSSSRVLIAQSTSDTSVPYPLEVIWPNWPPNIPGPELLRHLVEVFFTFHPHANRLFHQATFMQSLSYPPTHAKFPSAPVLHAICAISSLYTAAVTSPPLPDFNKIASDELFLEKHRVKEQRPDTFAEQQAKFARAAADKQLSVGEELFQVLQAHIILTWFHTLHSRWVDVFLLSAQTLRLSVPLGLSMCPPFHSITKFERAPSILPAAKTVIEDEMRRNAFWLAYTNERQHGLFNGWALCLDDQDISQLLPLRGDQFEQGILVTPLERQWAHAGDLILTHPEDQVDPFILYIKGTILISRVKVFNVRYRARNFAGDSAVTNLPSSNPLERFDPRGSPAFIELDHIATSFRASFPSHLRNPIANNVVDNHLYTACLMPHLAMIVLHDPHAEVRQSGCISALKILTAARAILDMIYNVWSTSYDITLLDSLCFFSWFFAGRVLVRFLQAAIDTNGTEQICTLRAELEFLHSAIVKVGQRIPLAHRFSKMLEDLVSKRCGPSFVTNMQNSASDSIENQVYRPLQEPGYESSNQTNGHPEAFHESGSFLSLA